MYIFPNPSPLTRSSRVRRLSPVTRTLLTLESSAGHAGWDRTTRRGSQFPGPKILGKVWKLGTGGLERLPLYVDMKALEDVPRPIPVFKTLCPKIPTQTSSTMKVVPKVCEHRPLRCLRSPRSEWGEGETQSSCQRETTQSVCARGVLTQTSVLESFIFCLNTPFFDKYKIKIYLVVSSYDDLIPNRLEKTFSSLSPIKPETYDLPETIDELDDNTVFPLESVIYSPTQGWFVKNTCEFKVHQKCTVFIMRRKLKKGLVNP